jgi:NitT/TauT family transport system ATP-binding protein
MTAHVNFNHISHTYTSDRGESLQVLDDVSFSIAKSEFVAVLGPSGCGKSTLLRLLAGLFQPSQGQVSIYGNAVHEPQDGIGIVFQKPTLLPWLNVIDNVLFPIRHKRGWISHQERKQALDLLTMAGLEGFAKHMPDQLSGGMQQRVGIVRALLLEPEILIMDEPFSALDALSREEMGFELLSLWHKKPKTVLFITHSISEAVLLADRVLVLSSRPARIAETINIEIPRPRNADSIHHKNFNQYTHSIRELIYQPA